MFFAGRFARREINHEQAQTGDGRQWHGRGTHPGGAAQARAGHVRHHRVRRRAASQLQPHPALPGAGRRTDLRGDRAQRPRLVQGQRHRPAHRLQGGRHRPPQPQGDRRRRQRGRLRPPAHGHRLQPVHPAGPRQRPRRGDRLSRHRRHRDDDGNRQDPPPCAGDRWRPARSGGGQRPQAARHGRHRGAHRLLAARPPAGPDRRPAAAERPGSARHPVPPQHPHRRAARQRRRPGLCRAVQGWRRDPRRPGGDGRRHPSQHRTGRARGPGLQPRHPGQRHPADLRSAHLRRRRVRQPPRHRLRSGRPAVRAGQGVRQPSGPVRHRHVQGLGDLDQAQGDRHRPVLRRRLHGRGRHRDHHPLRPDRWRVQEAGGQGRHPRRRLPVRRHRRRRLVFPPGSRARQHQRDPRPPDVRREHHRRRRPPGPAQHREHARRHGSVRLQRRVQGHHRQGHPGERPVQRRRGEEAHQGRQLLRLLHRAGRADPDQHRRWRGGRQAQE
ncbi:hypothetical protein D3C75_641120 [compost metagenome]